MRSKILLISTLLVAGLLGSLSGRPQIASGAGPCGTGARSVGGPPIGSAVHANRILRAESSGVDLRLATAKDEGAMLRHVAAVGRHLAFVRDEVGDDVLVVVTPLGTRSHPQNGEILHPAWSARRDLVWAIGNRLGHLDAGTGRIRAVPGPGAGGSLFSPVFATDNTVVVVRSAPPTRLVPEDDWSNDLWRLRFGSGGWRRLTRFSAGPDRWTAIRTPVAVGDGVVEFVRVVGRASQTEPPRFELWRASGRSVSRVRRLPGERYLAGVVDGDHLWNIPRFATATWRLVRELPDGSTVSLGCGAVAVEPMDTTDPDRRSPAGEHLQVVPEGSRDPSSGPAPAVLVGDFPDEAAAAAAAREVMSSYGPAMVEVIRHADAPTLLRPGAWAVLLHLEEGADAVVELDGFRERLPRFADISWMVTP